MPLLTRFLQQIRLTNQTFALCFCLLNKAILRDNLG